MADLRWPIHRLDEVTKWILGTCRGPQPRALDPCGEQRDTEELRDLVFGTPPNKTWLFDYGDYRVVHHYGLEMVLHFLMFNKKADVPGCVHFVTCSHVVDTFLRLPFETQITDARALLVAPKPRKAIDHVLSAFTW